jgi:uncharacterized protein YoaH (UPF0181 family)
MEIGRWSKYGNDRLYINAGISKADKYSLYVDLETHEIVSDNEGKHSGGSVTINGDAATIIIEESGDKEHEIVVSLTGDGFESDDDDETDEDSEELVADGGEDTTSHIDDSTIETAIEEQDGPLDDDRTATADAVRDALAWLQQSVEEHWNTYADNIEHDEMRVVHEDSDVIVLTTGEHDVPHRDLSDHYPEELGERVPDVVSAIHHELARDRCDYDWGYEYPLVIRKTGSFGDGQQYVEAVVNSLLRRGLSPGQAWAYYGSEIRDNSNNSWASRCGYSDHSAVSEPLRKAKGKL